MRIGIIGCGGIASQHVRGYNECPNAEVAAGADIDIDRAVRVAGPDHAYTSFQEMLAKEKPDAVSVCTPPKFHKEAVCAALEAGAAVLCEKPLALNAEEARRMVECARVSGRLLVTAFCHRFHDPVMRAREMIKSGGIGRVTMFRNRFGAKMDMTGVWFSKPEISGGGTIPDTSVHSIDLFRYLVGEPVRVSAALATADARYQVEDCSVVVVQTDDGAIGTIEASWTSPGSANVIEIYGTEGAIVIDYSKSGIRFMLEGSGQWQEEECNGPDRFVMQARHFVDCVRNGSKPIVDGTDGLRAAEVVDAAYAFARGSAGRWAVLD